MNQSHDTVKYVTLSDGTMKKKFLFRTRPTRRGEKFLGVIVTLCDNVTTYYDWTTSFFFFHVSSINHWSLVIYAMMWSNHSMWSHGVTVTLKNFSRRGVLKQRTSR
jgi:hypothetical protein